MTICATICYYFVLRMQAWVKVGTTNQMNELKCFAHSVGVGLPRPLSSDQRNCMACAAELRQRVALRMVWTRCTMTVCKTCPSSSSRSSQNSSSEDELLIS